MADLRSKRPRISSKYYSPDSSNLADQPVSPDAQQRSVKIPQSPEKRVTRAAKARKLCVRPKKKPIKINFPKKAQAMLNYAEPVTSSPADSSNKDKEEENGDASPPILTKLKDSETDQQVIETVEVQDDIEEPMPSLNIESPSTPFVLPSTELVEQEAVALTRVLEIEEEKPVELPVEADNTRKGMDWLSDDESSEGSVGCLDVDPSVTKDDVTWVANGTPVNSGTCELDDQNDSCEDPSNNLVSPLPPPLMPISNGSVGNQDPMHQESMNVNPMTECIEEEVITTEIKELIPIPTSPIVQPTVGITPWPWINMTIDELRSAEKQLNSKIESLSRKVTQSSAELTELENSFAVMQKSWEQASADFKMANDDLNRISEQAMSLRTQIKVKAEEVRGFMSMRNDAEVRAIKAEIQLKEVDLANLKRRLISLAEPNGSIELRTKINLKSEDRMTALLDDMKLKASKLEEAKNAYQMAENQEAKLKDRLRDVFQQINKTKQVCDAAGQKAKNIQSDMDRIQENIQRCRREKNSTSLELLDARDNLTEVELNRRRKEIQMEREMLVGPRNSVSPPVNAHPISGQVPVSQPISRVSNSIVTNTSIRKIRRVTVFTSSGF